MNIVSALLDVLYPLTCAACDVIVHNRGLYCLECGWTAKPAAGRRCTCCYEFVAEADSWCERCRVQAPTFRRTVSAFEHQGAVAKSIHRLKYDGRVDLVPRMAEAMVKSIPGHGVERYDGIVGVPIHSSRYRQREYDQGVLLAANVARRLRVPLVRRALQRTRATAAQVGARPPERAANLMGAFVADALAPGRYLLVDDVMTTGATADAAARALRAGGADQVDVVTFSRASRDFAASLGNEHIAVYVR